jgi:Asp-tRNA(Asn)/Glu-tRNA(Gln) amidotransferase A subunit family amidase
MRANSVSLFVIAGGEVWLWRFRVQLKPLGLVAGNEMPTEKLHDAAAANELLELTSSEAIHHIRCGSITAESYASRLLEQYRKTRQLNAITWIDENRVLASARAVDTARSKGQALGELAGLPLVFKDNINTVGFPTTAGTAILKGNYPRSDAAVVDICLKNGAILFGKTNMDELGRGFTSSNPTFGFARNPYDVHRVPGGGAGGEGAAISARIAPAGLGLDTAGSTRIPAAFCGIAGFRPSTGGGHRSTWTLGSWTILTWDDGLFPISYVLTTPGPMGRTVSDVALLHAIATGTTKPTPLPLRGARIGVPRGYYWEDIDPDVRQVSERAMEKLRAAGGILIDVDLRQWAQTVDPIFFTLGLMHSLKDVADFLTVNAPGVSVNEVVAGLLSRDIRSRVQSEIDNPVSVEQAQQARKMRVKLALQYEESLRRNDISAIVYPTVPVLAPMIRPRGDGPNDTIELNGKQVSQFAISSRNTHLSSAVGTPSLTLPAGLSSSGLPVGLSFDGLTGADSSLLGLALSVEAVLGRLPAPVLQSAA